MAIHPTANRVVKINSASCKLKCGSQEQGTEMLRFREDSINTIRVSIFVFFSEKIEFR